MTPALPPLPGGSRNERMQMHTPHHPEQPSDAGQGTVEYVLVMLVAAAIAWALIRWIQGGGTNGLLDALGGWLGGLVGMLWG